MRREHARRYDELLEPLKSVVTPKAGPYALHAYHIYAIRVPARDGLLKTLGEQGIGCGIHYPIPVHLQEAYAALGLGPGEFPVAEKCAAEFLSLPMYPELTAAQIATVVDGLSAALRGRVGQRAGAA